jgi:hypothetical protein
VGRELRALGREENAVAVLKEWARHGLLGAFHPRLARRASSPDRIVRLFKVRDAMAEQGYRATMAAPVISYALGKLSSRELAGTLTRLKFRAGEIAHITQLDREAAEIIKMLKGRKTKTPQDAYRYLESVPLEMLAYIQNETSQGKVLGKIKNYLFKWKPLRAQLPVMELESLGIARGPVFDKILEDFFQLQLAGRARQPQDRLPVLRKLAGIKPEKEKKVKEKEKVQKKEVKAEKTKAEGKSSPESKPKAADMGGAAVARGAESKGLRSTPKSKARLEKLAAVKKPKAPKSKKLHKPPKPVQAARRRAKGKHGRKRKR